MSAWDDAETIAFYEAFCERHSRYSQANRELIAHAQIAPEMRVLDVAAGTGRTAEAALPSIGESGSIVCFEPSAAMRHEGMRRMADSRVSWVESLPDATESFDRILCGAAMWQVEPLREMFQRLTSLLRPSGALCFNIPALYLSEPDEPGGGSDPHLLSLMELLMSSPDARLTTDANENPAPQSSTSEPLDQDSITAWLLNEGLRSCLWSFRLRISQMEYANWLKIPVLTEQLLGHLSPKERAGRIDAALASLKSSDRDSWKWEYWCGWTAWKDAAL